MECVKRTVKPSKWLLRWILFIGTLGFFQQAFAAPSGPRQESAPKPEVVIYNEGVELLKAGQFAEAGQKFEKSLEIRERFAEAHNNLAYTLRKQGRNEEALKHYNRALEINGRLIEAYMYRGVLHVTMGNLEAAKEDLAVLERRRSDLALELAYVIENGREKTPEQFFGVTGLLR
jgi:tetratricopeptide (TPR) repeat protein